MGQYDKALPLFVRALLISEKAEGPEHPATGTRLNNLAELHKAMGQYELALPLYVRALAISEKSEGPEHPGTGRESGQSGRVAQGHGSVRQGAAFVCPGLVDQRES